MERDALSGIRPFTVPTGYECEMSSQEKKKILFGIDPWIVQKISTKTLPPVVKASRKIFVLVVFICSKVLNLGGWDPNLSSKMSLPDPD